MLYESFAVHDFLPDSWSYQPFNQAADKLAYLGGNLPVGHFGLRHISFATSMTFGVIHRYRGTLKRRIFENWAR